MSIARPLCLVALTIALAGVWGAGGCAAAGPPPAAVASLLVNGE